MRRALILAIVLVGGCDEPTAQIQPLPPPTAAPPPPPKTTEPRAKTLDERVDETAERDRELKENYRSRHKMWTALLPEARGTKHEDAIREHLERIESAANKSYREAYRPVYEEVHALPPREARAKLAAWKPPEELDILGEHAAAQAKELEALDERIALGEARAKLDGSVDPEPALAKFLRSTHLAVRAEAEAAVAELRVGYQLRRLAQKMDARRAAALSRLEIVRDEIKRDEAAVRDRIAGWEKRLKETTTKRPFSLKPFGIDFDQDVRVAKFDGRRITFAAEGVEFGFGMDEVHHALFGHVMLNAADPKSGRDLFEAGRLAVRRESYDAAAKLFDQAVRVDKSLAPVAPDVARIRRGIASLAGDVTVSGSTLTVKYAGRDAEAKDFVTPERVTLLSRGDLTVSGAGFYYAVPKDLSFVGTARFAFDGVSCGESAAVGVMIEPSNETAVLEWGVIQGKTVCRIQVLHKDRQPRVLPQVEIAATIGSAEVRIDNGRMTVRAGSAKIDPVELGTVTRIRPFFGGIAYEGRSGMATFRSLTFEGRVSGSWVQRLRAERSAILEAELAKEGRTTKEERAATDFVSARSFGYAPILAPIPLERELASIQPPRVGEHLSLVRKSLAEMEKAKDDAWSDLAGRVDEALGQAIAEASWYPLTWYYRAEFRDMLGDVAGALADLAEAAKRSASFVEARVARAELLLEQQRRVEAAKELDAALEAVPDLARARQSRALLHYYEGRPEPAIAEVELAMRLEPANLALRRSCKRLRSVVAGPLWSDAVTIQTKNYSIRGEVPKVGKKGQAQAAQKVKERLDRFAGHLEAAREYFATLVPGRPVSVMKPVVYFFASAESYYVYADFTQEDRMEHSAGVFLPVYRQMLFFDEESEQGTLETMAHEAFHEYVYAIAPHVPTWLNEGMAEFAAGIEVQGGRVTSSGRVIPGRLRVMQRALEDGGFAGIPFELMMRQSPQQFYSSMPDIQYAQAWSMVHFFRHRHAELLARYVRLIAEGATGADAFRETFGKRDLSAMRAEWRDYVRVLR